MHRRALGLLSASFGLSFVPVAMLAAPGPAAWVRLSGDAAQAGVYFALVSVSAALGAFAGGRAMDRFGRKGVLVAAHAGAAAAFAGAGLAIVADALGPFALCIALASFATGVIALTRLAAGELYPPEQRARAVARVQVAATFGALLGPLLLVLAAMGSSPGTLVWFLAPPAYLAAALLVLLAPLARPAATTGAAPAHAPIAARRPLWAGVLALACAQAAMVTVMGVTGVALGHQGHGAEGTAIVMAAHFLGMFGLSLVVGRVADRAGRRRTMLAGLAVLALGGLVVAFVPGILGLAPGLLLVGLGWSFAYIGGTVVVTDVVPPARRARVLGLVDFGTALGAALASVAGGWWYAARGLEGLGLVAVAVVAMPFMLALTLREAKPGAYGASAAPP